MRVSPYLTPALFPLVLVALFFIGPWWQLVLILLVCRVAFGVYTRPKQTPKPLPCFKSGGSAGPLMFMIHGWPDDHHVWDAQVAHFGKRYRTVTIDLPHYGSSSEEAGNWWGYDQDELVARCAVTLEKSLAEAGQRHAVLVVHDWGAFLGMQLQRRYPTLVSHLVVIDVVWPSAQPARLSQLHLLVLLGVLYQYWLALSWVIATGVPIVGAALGTAMTRLMMLSAGPPASSLDVRKNALSASMNFMYFYHHWITLGEMLGLLPGFDARHGTKDAPVPTLFFYAADKGFMFHPESFVRNLLQRTDCGVVKVDRTKNGGNRVGHWVQVTAAAVVNTEMDAWLPCPSLPASATRKPVTDLMS